MNVLSFFTEKIVPIFQSIKLPQIIEIALIFIMVAFLMILLEKNNARKISVVLVFYVVIVSVLCVLLQTTLTDYLILIVAFAVCVIFIFSIEIKRSVWNTKQSKKISSVVADAVRNNQQFVNQNINEIIKAVQNMSKNDIGAIIVLSKTKIPPAIIDSGVKLDSDISSALIESIFSHKTPLHDGAVIIQNDKILAAGCFLPLSQESDLPKDLGTRHRAGIGVTEILNVVSIIVSEETGIISIVKGGKITRYADSEMLRKVLKEYYWQELLGFSKENKQSKGGNTL